MKVTCTEGRETTSPSTAPSMLAVRGHFVDVPDSGPGAAIELRTIEDGLLLVRKGCIHWFGPWSKGRENIPAGCPILEYPGHILVPGFVDCHLHFPQIEMIASPSHRLLDWLQRFTYPAEEQYADPRHGERMASLFLDLLLKNGTTTAMVFCTVHSQSVEALFDAAEQRTMLLIGGKVLMDRNAPLSLCDTPQDGYEESRRLIETYHGRGRLRYGVTPRFAPTSTPEQLELAGRLLLEYPDVHLQTHLAEQEEEIAWVNTLFPERTSYLDVYDHHGLVGPASVFAHCLHLQPGEWDLLQQRRAAIAFCPSSNLFLGSGLFDLDQAWKRGIRVGLATDVGAGTSLSMLQTLNEAYKVSRLQHKNLSPAELLYLATLGGAKALGLEENIGTFTVGKDADFLVLDPRATDLLALRTERAQTLEELLFVLMLLGDDRVVLHTYVSGRRLYDRDGRDTATVFPTRAEEGTDA